MRVRPKAVFAFAFPMSIIARFWPAQPLILSRTVLIFPILAQTRVSVDLSASRCPGQNIE